jgi:hypothetical protein
VVVATDEVTVRAPQRRHWQELRTARGTTPQGYRYLRGTGAAFLAQWSLFLLLGGDPAQGLRTVLGDGARWIRDCFQWRVVLLWQQAELILDWYHRKKQCYQLPRMLCRGRTAKQELLKLLLRHLWHGQGDLALALLQRYRPQTKNEEKRDELIGYIQKNRQAIPHSCERRQHRQCNGSAHAEKANDVLVARRQKHQGMPWSLATSDALCALKIFMLHGGWDLYWQHSQVLPLAS